MMPRRPSWLLLPIALGAVCAARAPAQQGTITAARVDAAPRADPDAPAWSQATEIELPLFGQAIVLPRLLEPTVHALRVRALHDQDWLALRLEWADPQPDDRNDVSSFPDAAAVQFAPRGHGGTSPFMGGAEAPVHIVQWRAVAQRDAERGRPRRIQDLYPNAWVDVYPPYGPAPAGADSGAGAERERRYFVAGAAGNPVAAYARPSPVEELWAAGPGTLASQPEQDAEGGGRWRASRWAVVIAVPRHPRDTANAAFPDAADLAVAFAVWDGGVGQVGARKQYHPWVALRLGAPAGR